MQWTVNRRFTEGFYFTTSYTISKSLDYVSSMNETGSGPNGASGETDLAQNPFNLKAEHGPSIFDARHRWVDERLLGAAVLEKWDGRGQSSIRWLAVERHREFQ